MKKTLSLLLAFSIVATCFVFVPVVSADEAADPYAITVPSTWELIGEESFIRQPVDNGDGTTTNKFPLYNGTATETIHTGLTAYSGNTVMAENITLSSYTYDFSYAYDSNFVIGGAPVSKTVNACYYHPTNKKYYTTKDAEGNTITTQVNFTDDIYVDKDGLNVALPASDYDPHKNGSFSIEFAKYMDVSTSNDYYIMYDMKGFKENDTTMELAFCNSEEPTSQLKSTLKSNNNLLSLTNSIVSSEKKYESEASINQNFADINGKWHRYVVQISSRPDGEMLMREKSFNIDAGEIPTLTPDFWDNAVKISDAEIDFGGKLDAMSFYFNHNSGSGKNFRFKNLKIYKAPAVNSYVTPTVDGAGNEITGSLVTDAFYSTPNYNYTMTMDEAPAECEVVSQGWYDYSDPQNPVLLAEGRTINVPASMKGKLLKAVSVIKQGDVTTTYYPFSGYVRDYVELRTVNNKTLENQSPYTVKATYYSKPTDTKTTTSGSNSATKALTLAQWQSATKVEITASLDVGMKANVNDGLVVVTLAQYDKDGTLKKVTTSKPDLKNFTAPLVVGDYSIRSYPSFKITLSNTDDNPNKLNFEPGDTFKLFTWRTTTTPAAVDGKYYYNYEEIIPVVYNPMKIWNVIDVTQPIITIPAE